jgi:hypothetical protein
MRETKNTLLAYSDGEVVIRDATSNDAYQTQGQLAEVDAMLQVRGEEATLMKNMIWKRLADFQYINHVAKSLTLIQYLVEQDEARNTYELTADVKARFEIINQLRYYKFFQGDQEIGYLVRDPAERLFHFLFMREEEKRQMEAPQEIIEIREEVATGEKKMRKIKKIKKVKKSRRGSNPEEVAVSDMEGTRRMSAPEIPASPIEEFNEDYFDMMNETGFETTLEPALVIEPEPSSVFDELEQDLKSLRGQEIKPARPMMMAAAPAPVQIVYVPQVFVQPQMLQPKVALRPDYDLTLAPRSSNYRRGHDPSQKSAVKSIEDLLGASGKPEVVRKKSEPVNVLEMTIDEMVGFYGSSSARRESEKHVEEIKMMDDDHSEVLFVEAPKVPKEMMPIVAPPAPVVVAPPVNVSKTQVMAQEFDKLNAQKSERRNSLPQDSLHNGEMYIVSGMRPVKPVHALD